jgi:hypothetical protein
MFVLDLLLLLDLHIGDIKEVMGNIPSYNERD